MANRGTQTKQHTGAATAFGGQPKPNGQAPAVVEEKITTYTPLGESKEVNLSVNFVRTHLCKPTKKGHWPSDEIVRQYIAVCAHRRLNPFVGDCWLLGYDSEKYGPQFSIVVAVQSLFKRAEIAKDAEGHPLFDGIESGVIVVNDDHELVERQGDFMRNDEVLAGGWAKVYRKDRSRPFYQALNLSVYEKDTPQWKSDPSGMIVKCAEAGALRQSFPSDIGGLYLEHEMREADATATGEPPAAKPATSHAAIKERLAVGNTPPPRQEPPGGRQEDGGHNAGEGPGDATGGDQGDEERDSVAQDENEVTFGD
jgi:phage recombination protein Bet